MIGEKIKKIIEKSEFSVSDIAQKIGTTNQNLYYILKKDSIESKYLEKIAAILNVPVCSFFENKDSQKEAKDFMQIIEYISQKCSISFSEHIQSVIATLSSEYLNIEEFEPSKFYAKVVKNVLIDNNIKLLIKYHVIRDKEVLLQVLLSLNDTLYLEFFLDFDELKSKSMADFADKKLNALLKTYAPK